MNRKHAISLMIQVTITPMYPPFSRCQLYRADINHTRRYLGYVDFCHDNENDEFKGVRKRNELNQWIPVEDWFPTIETYLQSLPTVFDICYAPSEIDSFDSIRRAICDAWETYQTYFLRRVPP